MKRRQESDLSARGAEKVTFITASLLARMLSESENSNLNNLSAVGMKSAKIIFCESLSEDHLFQWLFG